MRTLYVPLPEDALARLVDLARREFREPKAQAAQLIVDGLRRAEPVVERSADAPRRAEGER